MPKNMNDRKKKILQAIVEEYIETAEPVSSGSLVNNYDLNCSKNASNIHGKVFQWYRNMKKLWNSI